MPGDIDTSVQAPTDTDNVDTSDTTKVEEPNKGLYDAIGGFGEDGKDPDSDDGDKKDDQDPDGKSDKDSDPDKKEGDEDKDKDDKPEYVPVTTESLEIPKEFSEEMKMYGYDTDKGLEIFNEYAKEKGLSPEIAKDISDMYLNKFVKAQIELNKAQIDRDYETLTKHYKTEKEFNEAQVNVSKAMKTLFGDRAKAVTEKFRVTGMGLDPDVYKAFDKVGRLLSDDKGTRSREVGKGGSSNPDLFHVLGGYGEKK